MSHSKIFQLITLWVGWIQNKCAICQKRKRVQNCTKVSKCADIKICTIVQFCRHQAWGLWSSDSIVICKNYREAPPCWLQGGPTPRFNHFVPSGVNLQPLVKLILLETANHCLPHVSGAEWKCRIDKNQRKICPTGLTIGKTMQSRKISTYGEHTMKMAKKGGDIGKMVTNREHSR